MENENKTNVLFQIHLFFTFFLFLLLPCVNNHFQPELSESIFLGLALLNGLVGMTLCVVEGYVLIPFRRALICFYLFCGFIVIHYFFSPKNEEGRQFVNGIILLMLFTFNITQACRTKKIGLLFLSAIFINGLFQIILGFNQHFISTAELTKEISLYGTQDLKDIAYGASSKQFLERLEAHLSTGWFIYPNAFAAYMGLFIFALIAFYFDTIHRNFSKFISYLFILFAGCAILCIFFAGAKGVFLALGISFILFILFYFVIRKYKKVSDKFYFIIVSCLTIGIVLVPILFKNILSLNVRLNYWRAGLAMFVKEASYWLGLGAGGFNSYYLKYKLPLAEEVQKPHNYFMTVLVEQGIIGLCIFLLFLGYLFYYLLKNKPTYEEINEPHDEAMPKRVYLFVFFVIFAIFMAINPTISHIASGLSFLTLFTLVILFLILVLRFLKNKNVFSYLIIEKVLPIQMLLLTSCLVICFTDLIKGIINLDGWPNFQEFNDNKSAFFILVLIVIFFIALNYRKIIVTKVKTIEFMELSKALAILLVLYFVLMIGGDMVGEYISFVVTFIVLVLVISKMNLASQSEVKFPSQLRVFAFTVLYLAGSFFIFEKFFIPDVLIARMHYLYDHYYIEGATPKDGIVEMKEGILEVGQKKFPDHLFFPLEKAKLYDSIGFKFAKTNNQRISSAWYVKAIQEIDICIRIAPQKANLYDYKADLMEKNDENQKQIEIIRLKALELYPVKAHYSYQLGNFYKKVGNQEKALQYFEKAMYLHKNSHRYTQLIPEEFDSANRYIIENGKKTDYNLKSE